MGIRDIIEKKKNRFFVARDSDKLQLQKNELLKERDRLATERKDVEEVRKLQAEIKQHDNAIHESRTSGSRAFGQKLKAGFGNFSQNVKRLDEGRGQADIWKKDTFGSVNDGPFSTGGPMGKPSSAKPKEKKASGQHIHVHIGGK